jgi:succinate-semialdehyde dehydrogenase/glutarate-semialdehyde dehydrogenase
MSTSPKPSYEKLEMYIDGQWCTGSDGVFEDVVNPATEEVVGRVPHASVADLDRALAAAQKAFRPWSVMAPSERGVIIEKAAQLMKDRLEHIATTLTIEQGKPLAEARGESTYGADIVKWYAEEGRRAYGRIIPGRAGARQIVLKQPIGPSAAFTPWNFPIVTPARKIGGALAAGCTLILKASEETPGAAVAMVRCFHDAGVPPGVLNLVFGVPGVVSEHIIRSPIIRKFSFTGSIPVGKHLAKLAAEGMKRATMELGGHAPVIVFDDVDPEKAAIAGVGGKFRNAGQVCVSPTRFFVQEKIYDRFVAKFAEAAKALKVGDGLDPTTQMGPLANPRRIAAMDGFVSDAIERGAKLAAGGRRIGERGYFYAPTVLTHVPADARVMNDEPFGPMAPIVPFKDMDEAIERANALPYGLAGYFFTRSEKTAMEVSTRMETGLVGVNNFAISVAESPFGGMKESGYGSEGGSEGLDAYLVTKYINEVAG